MDKKCHLYEFFLTKFTVSTCVHFPVEHIWLFLHQHHFHHQHHHPHHPHLHTIMMMVMIILEEIVSFLLWVALGFHPRSLKHVEYCLHDDDDDDDYYSLPDVKYVKTKS